MLLVCISIRVCVCVCVVCVCGVCVCIYPFIYDEYLGSVSVLLWWAFRLLPYIGYCSIYNATINIRFHIFLICLISTWFIASVGEVKGISLSIIFSSWWFLNCREPCWVLWADLIELTDSDTLLSIFCVEFDIIFNFWYFSLFSSNL